MFAYIDPTIRERLITSGKLKRIDSSGREIDINRAPKTADNDFTLNVVGPIPLPIDVGETEITFQWFAFVRTTQLTEAEEIVAAMRQRGDKRLHPLLSAHMSINSALVYGDLSACENPLVRVHSSCLSGDVFGSKRCECGPQLSGAMQRIVEDPGGSGVLVYMAGHEGRGIGLWAKAITYLLQDAGQDTYQANRSLGLPEDSRDFSDAAAILLYLLGGDQPFRLLSNNPKKREDLLRCGLTRFVPEKHLTGVNRHNERYLLAKRDWGHVLKESDIKGSLR